jgi:hypothetical protein
MNIFVNDKGEPFEFTLDDWRKYYRTQFCTYLELYLLHFAGRLIDTAETSADREFWQTQADVLSDVQTAINERINPKEKKNE